MPKKAAQPVVDLNDSLSYEVVWAWRVNAASTPVKRRRSNRLRQLREHSGCSQRCKEEDYHLAVEQLSAQLKKTQKKLRDEKRMRRAVCLELAASNSKIEAAMETLQEDLEGEVDPVGRILAAIDMLL